MSNTINYGTKFYANTFIWNMNDFLHETTLRSDIFQFCGYCCYLFLECLRMGGKCYLTMKLRGNKVPYAKEVSCRYSIFLVNDVGRQSMNKSGEIKCRAESIKVVFYDVHENVKFDHDHSTVCFSWCDEGYSEAHSQSVQTEQVISINIREQGTQTEEIQMPPTKNICTYAECSTNAFKHQTSITADDSPIARHIETHEEIERHKFLDTLSNNFESFFEKKTDPDCVLRVDETKFAVHRSVLSARSPVFAAMFHHDTTESQSGEVDIKDVDSGPFGDVLYFIYTGKVRGLSPETAASMYSIANKYALMDIREKCLEYLTCNLTLENICDAVLLAHTHAEADLENKTVQFIKERQQDLMENEKWKSFSDTHYKLANKLLCSALIASKTGHI